MHQSEQKSFNIYYLYKVSHNIYAIMPLIYTFSISLKNIYGFNKNFIYVLIFLIQLKQVWGVKQMFRRRRYQKKPRIILLCSFLINYYVKNANISK